MLGLDEASTSGSAARGNKVPVRKRKKVDPLSPEFALVS